MQTEQTTALHILMNDDLYFIARDFTANESFLEEPLKEEITTKTVLPQINFIGKNQKNFLILTNEALQDNHLKALESTLLRKQLHLDDVAIVDYSIYQNLGFEDFDASFMPQKLVLFGLVSASLSLPESKLNIITNTDNLVFLVTYSFDEMLGNKEKTKAFWEPMKIL